MGMRMNFFVGMVCDDETHPRPASLPSLHMIGRARERYNL